jgi:hypothetical protein
MSALNTIQIRLGILTLAISGLIFTIGYALAGPFVQAMGNPNDFVRVAGSLGFRVGMFINPIGIALQFFGFLALYVYFSKSDQARLAFIAWLLATGGVGLTLPPTGVLPFVFPHIADLYAQGALAAFDVATAIFAYPLFTAVLALAGLLVTLGSILFSVAIWRQGRLPKVAAILFTIANLFLSFAPAIPVTALVWPIDLAGAVLLLISGAWITAGVWQQSSV